MAELNKELAEAEKNKGNNALKQNNFQEALKCYTKSIEYCPLISATYCNRALIYLKLNEFTKCIDDCNKALKLQPDYSKALHRRGKANISLKNYEQGISDFEAIIVLEPDNQEVKKDLEKAKAEYLVLNPEPTKKNLEVQPSEDNTKLSPGSIDINKNNINDSKEKKDKDSIEKLLNDALTEQEKKTIVEKLAILDDLNSKAKNFVQIGNYDKAIEEYEKCLNYLNNIITTFTSLDQKNSAVTSRKCTYFNNIALCYSKIDVPKKVIDYSSKVIDLGDIDKDMLIKAYLRRALAYEKLDKNLLAKKDYEAIKDLHPSNLQASEGLSRVQQILNESMEKNPSEKVQIPPSSSDTAASINFNNNKEEIKIVEKPTINIKDLELRKEKVNDLFRKKNFDLAEKEFLSAIIETEELIKKKNLQEEDKENLNKLFIQLLTNRALALFNLNKLNESIADCTKVLAIDQNHQKCLFRRGICNAKIADSIKTAFPEEKDEFQLELKQIEYYEKSRKDMEYLYKLDMKNKEVNDKIQELIKVLVTLKLKHKKLNEANNANKQSSNIKEEKKVEQDEKTEKTKPMPDQQKKSKNVQLPSGMSKDVLDKITNNAVKNITETLMQSEELPKTSSQFENNCQAFKKNIDKLYFYLKRIPQSHLKSLYEKAEINIDLLLSIVNSIKIAGINDDPKFCLDLLKVITETNKFSINIKFANKAEKKDIANILNQIQNKIPEEDNNIFEMLRENYLLKTL